MRVLFLLKYRENTATTALDTFTGPFTGSLASGYCDTAIEPYSTAKYSSGLLNSAGFIAYKLHTLGNQYVTDCRVEEVVDADSIYQKVDIFLPDVVVIEAFWVTPDKFKELAALYPNVIWVVRNHSSAPFAATEGIIMKWSLDYMDCDNVYVSCNDKRMANEMRQMIRMSKPDMTDEEIEARTPYLPNYYPADNAQPRQTYNRMNRVIDIACFGAVRQMKNHLTQAIAAIQYAERHKKSLRFHINATRMEGSQSNTILRNLRDLFANASGHELIEHDWLPHDEFLQLIGSMHLSMQVSFSETFNIVTADAVIQGVPVVTSHEITWVEKEFRAEPTSSTDIMKKIERALNFHTYKTFQGVNPNLDGLRRYNKHAIEEWVGFLNRVR